MALINGKVYDWSDVSISVTNFTNIELSEISYDDEQDAEIIPGAGGKIRGFGTGEKKNTVKVSMLREDYDEICRVLKTLKITNFYKYIFPKITVNYANESGQTVTDVLTKVKFNKRAFKAASGDKSLKVDLDGFSLGGITTNGINA